MHFNMYDINVYHRFTNLKFKFESCKMHLNQMKVVYPNRKMTSFVLKLAQIHSQLNSIQAQSRNSALQLYV